MDDVGMRKFLWCDYFHDSIISDISFDSTSKKVKWYKDLISLTIHCDRDSERAYNALSKKAYPDDWQEFLMREDFTYIVSFCGVEYFEIKNETSSMEYLNGRFKDTQIVRKLNAENKTPYYHFRIRITGGYIDIVFKRLKIKKLRGRVNYATKGYNFDYDPLQEFDGKYDERPLKFPTKEDDDFACFELMQKLFLEGDPALADYARECLKSELLLDCAKPYAAYVLGKVGKKCDLDLVKKTYFQASNELQKRHILDAIEILEAI